MSRKKERRAAAGKPASTGRKRARTIMLSIAAVIAVLGVAETTYLTVLHLSGANVVCLGTSRCSEVLRSVYASFGGVPLAAIGGVGYFVAFGSALLAAYDYRRAATVLGITIALMFLGTLALLYIQAFVLKAFCDYCLLSAALVFLLAGVIALPARRD
jgi:uncharacterized membrane protein